MSENSDAPGLGTLPDNKEQSHEKTVFSRITLRSVLVGLAGASLICAFSFFNDRVMRQTFLVGNNFPASVYGMLFVFLFCINRWLKRWAFTGAELAVILTLTLAACCIPGSGLLRSFTSSIALPHHFQRTQVGWQKYDLVGQVPEHMMVDVSVQDGKAVDGMVQGWQGKDGEFSLDQIPWSAWKRTLWFWIPLILTLWVAMMLMTLIFHRQWSEHECLSYPLANFVDELLPQSGQTQSPVFKQTGFWVAALVVFLIYMNNYGCRWFPQQMISVPTKLYFSSLIQDLKVFQHGYKGVLFDPTIYLIAVGIGYLLPRSISFSYGIGPYLWSLLTGVCIIYGLQLNHALDGGSHYMGLTPRSFQLFGANIGIFLIILYSGRDYLKRVFGQAFGMKPKDDQAKAEKTIVIACRVFMALMLLFTLQLVLSGIPIVFAVFYSMILIVFYAVMSRLIAETGLFYIQPFFFPCVMMLGVFGAASMGPKVILIMQMISVVLLIDPRESLAPFMANSLKMLELRKVKLGKMVNLSIASVVIGLAIALPVTLYFQYQRGSEIWNSWGDVNVPKMPFQNALSVQRRLEARGVLSPEGPQGFIQSLKNINANKVCVIALFGGLAAVLLVGWARLRIPWWPLHPLIFVTWATAPPARMGASFLLGWLIKSLVIKYGGNSAVNRIKPIIYGLMAGEILAAVFPSVVGLVYYLTTGEAPRAFHVWPL